MRAATARAAAAIDHVLRFVVFSNIAAPLLYGARAGTL